MMSLTFGLFTQVSGSGPLGPLVLCDGQARRCLPCYPVCEWVGRWSWVNFQSRGGGGGDPTIGMIVGQGPIALALGVGWGCLNIFTLLYLFSSLSPSLWEMA